MVVRGSANWISGIVGGGTACNLQHVSGLANEHRLPCAVLA